MTPEEFRRHGHRLVDWIADYRARAESLPVMSTVEPGAIKAALPASPPAKGEAFEQVMADLDTTILPGLTQWQHPGFYAYFPSNGLLCWAITSAPGSACLASPGRPARR